MKRNLINPIKDIMGLIARMYSKDLFSVYKVEDIQSTCRKNIMMIWEKQLDNI